MNRFIALLRGINIGSHHRIAMPALKELFEDLGCQDVATYLQSGNVVCDTSLSAKQLADQAQKAIKQQWGHGVAVIVRSKMEMQQIVKSNPFLDHSKLNLSRLYVTFLDQPPSQAAVASINPEVGGADLWQIQGPEIYLYCPGGYGTTKLTNGMFERKLGVAATTRNWKTTTALAAS